MRRLSHLRFREPLLLPFAAVAAGVVIPFFTGITFCETFVPAAAIGALAAAAWFCRSRVLALAASLIALCLAGIALVAAHPDTGSRGLSVADNTPALFEGCVTDPAMVAADRERFTVDLARGARANVVLFARPTETFPELPYGTRIEFEGKARQTHNYNNPGEFDAVHFYARQRIYWNLSAISSRSSSSVSAPPHSPASIGSMLMTPTRTA